MEAARSAVTAADKLIRNIVNDLIMKRIGQKICHHTRFEVGDYALRENKLRFLAENYLVIRNFHIFVEDNKPIKQLDMKNLVDQINAQIEVFSVNAAAQVEKNNKAAGTRARKAALELTKLLKEFRKMSVEEAKK